jgi:hypothetical protein
MRRYRIFCMSIIFLAGCSGSNNTLDGWLGSYTYSERPVEVAGSNLEMDWELDVYKIGKIYKAQLNVNGDQANFSLFNDLAGNDTVLHVIYNQPADSTGHILQKGDTLFSLLKNGVVINTRWGALEPMLLESSPKQCRCFKFIGKDKNNNTIIIDQPSSPFL